MSLQEESSNAFRLLACLLKSVLATRRVLPAQQLSIAELIGIQRIIIGEMAQIAPRQEHISINLEPHLSDQKLDEMKQIRILGNKHLSYSPGSAEDEGKLADHDSVSAH